MAFPWNQEPIKFDNGYHVIQAERFLQYERIQHGGWQRSCEVSWTR